MLSYWDYYDDDFDWDDGHSVLRPNLALTRQTFADIGLSISEIDSFVKSGYLVLEQADVVIDRYYGGPLLRTDERTRFSTPHFLECYKNGRNAVFVASATSLKDVLRQVEKLRAENSRPLLFRGQTSSYPLNRERPNPHLQVNGFGEISLLPSLWRRMLEKNPSSFHEFRSPLILDWEPVILDRFDMNEVRRSIEQINAGGGWIYTAQDMEDSNDPLLHEYGRDLLDLTMGHDLNLADCLATLLKHYGLVSPVLDLTSSLDVALFFASHRLQRDTNGLRYTFVGSNNGRSVLYVFRQDKTEMREYEHERVMNKLRPLRPERQSCVICLSSSYALNLAADFLVGVIKMDFPHELPRKFTTSDLFPGEAEDKFLSALKRKLLHPEYVTNFQC
jgi:FRG domain